MSFSVVLLMFCPPLSFLGEPLLFVFLPSLYVCDLAVGSVIAYWYITHQGITFLKVLLFYTFNLHAFFLGIL